MADPVIKVEFTGTAALYAKWNSMHVDIRNRLKHLVQRTSLEIQNDARIATPKDMGMLTASVNMKLYQNGLTAWIGSELKYAAFIEYGTGPLGRSTNQQQLPSGYIHGSRGGFPPLILIREWCKRHAIPQNLAFVIARKISRSGLRARPYLGPAFRKHAKGFEDEVLKIVGGVTGPSGGSASAPPSSSTQRPSGGGRARDPNTGRFI